jgi:threonine aldolase
LIAKGRRLRKMLGGGLRQSGILAAAGLYALDNNVNRLADDHANSRALAEGLAALPGLELSMPDTNILFVNVKTDIAPSFAAFLASKGIGLTSTYGALQQRWVTHLDVSREDVDFAVATAKEFFATR